MKKITSILLIPLFLLSACNVPKQFLKDKRPLAAFQSCSSRINNGSFFKKHVPVFEDSFHQINQNSIRNIERSRQSSNPEDG